MKDLQFTISIKKQVLFFLNIYVFIVLVTRYIKHEPFNFDGVNLIVNSIL